MALDSTKQKFVLVSTLSRLDEPRGTLALIEAMEETSRRAFGSDRFALHPARLEALIDDFVDAGMMSMTRAGAAIMELGRTRSLSLHRYLAHDEIERGLR